MMKGVCYALCAHNSHMATPCIGCAHMVEQARLVGWPEGHAVLAGLRDRPYWQALLAEYVPRSLL